MRKVMLYKRVIPIYRIDVVLRKLQRGDILVGMRYQ